MTPLLHVYSQPAPHDTVYITGNQAGLRSLLFAIAEALGGGVDGDSLGTAPAYAADGEGFRALVQLLPGDLGDDRWIRQTLPYTDPYTVDCRPDTLSPWLDPLVQDRELQDSLVLSGIERLTGVR